MCLNLCKGFFLWRRKEERSFVGSKFPSPCCRLLLFPWWWWEGTGAVYGYVDYFVPVVGPSWKHMCLKKSYSSLSNSPERPTHLASAFCGSHEQHFSLADCGIIIHFSMITRNSKSHFSLILNSLLLYQGTRGAKESFSDFTHFSLLFSHWKSIHKSP